MESLFRQYFPSLQDATYEKLAGLKEIYQSWNSRINVISRKDMDNFYVHHVLHSLSIAAIINFHNNTRIIDAGTGGGFPGIPLAIMFPEAEFTLLDSIEKKIKVVSEVAKELQLSNVLPVRKRMEEEKGLYDFVVSRAVTGFPELVKLTGKNIRPGHTNTLANGLIALKGGELSAELGNYFKKARIWSIADIFREPFFETKKIVYLPT